MEQKAINNNRKGHKSILILLLALLGSLTVAWAVEKLFFTSSITTEFSKKTIFEFNLSAGVNSAELGPGDSVSANLNVENTATEKMYVFVEIDAPTVDGTSLYEYDVDSSWILVEKNDGNEVWAYGNTELTELRPGEATNPLTEKITMKSISNAEYAEIENINITFTGYAIDTTLEISDPTNVWEAVKMLK